MKMYSYGANSMRDIETFVNERHINKDAIVSIMQTSDGTFLLTYFGE